MTSCQAAADASTPGCLPLHANARCTPWDAAGRAHKSACMDCGLVISVSGGGAGTRCLRAGRAGREEGRGAQASACAEAAHVNAGAAGPAEAHQQQDVPPGPRP